jgi:aryl-alcohol dehydrogenase-like predicted oxidoreductase
MWAHQFADALHTSDRLGLERFATMQNHYNLAYREEEREMLPLCQREGIGVIPWSPIARGYLTRPDESFRETTRGTFMDEDDHYARRIAAYRANGGVEINERVEELADGKGVTMAQIALSWLLHKDWVTAPIIGTTSVEHLEDAVEAVEIDLSDSDIEYLQDPYEPGEVLGHE